jgi:hypothetical protein
VAAAAAVAGERAWVAAMVRIAEGVVLTLAFILSAGDRSIGGPCSSR